MIRLSAAPRAATHSFSILLRGGLFVGMLLIALICLARLAVWPVSADEHIFRMAASHLPGIAQPDGHGHVDLMAAEAFRRIDVNFETIFLPGKRAKAMLNQGNIDGYLTGTPSLKASAPNAIMVPEPHTTIDFVALSRNAVTRLAGWDDLTRYDAAYIRGHKYFDRHVKNSGDRLILLNDYATIRKYFLHRSADQGGVTFVLMSRSIAHTTFGVEIGRNVFIVEPPLGSISVHFFVHKRHRDLVPRLDKALREMRLDGTNERLRKQAKAYETSSE